MREEPRHLKRGLKDLSPLYQSVPQKARPPVSALSMPLQSLSVLCPESPSRTLFLNASLASKMQSLAYDCALISVGNKTQESTPVKRFCLSLRQFEEVWHSKTRFSENFGISVVFFDFDYAHPILLKKVMPILDKWILLIKPDQESVTEGYKFMKASLPLNPNLEYFMLANGISNQASSRLFERFSEMVSRRLGVTLHGIGHFDPRFPSSYEGIAVEGLERACLADSVEKRAFAGFLK